MVSLTAAAPHLGARPSGLAAAFPLYTAVLAVFAQRLHGPAAAVEVLRGLLFGLVGFAAFFALVAALVDVAATATAFASAGAASLLLQAAALLILREFSGRS